MGTTARNRALSLIAERGGYVRSRDLRAAGIHPSELPTLERAGIVVRLKRGLYALPSGVERDQRLEALLAVPGSVLCLASALAHHRLGTWEPPQIYLAIQAGRRVVLPDGPPIRLFHFAAETFDLGLSNIRTKGGAMRVYNAERTVCDLFRFRHRLGKDVAMEALREYLKRRARKVNAMLDYAGRLHVLGPLRAALEALL